MGGWGLEVVRGRAGAVRCCRDSTCCTACQDLGTMPPSVAHCWYMSLVMLSVAHVSRHANWSSQPVAQLHRCTAAGHVQRGYCSCCSGLVLSCSWGFTQTHDPGSPLHTSCLRSGEVETRPGVLRLMDEAREMGIKVAVCSAATKPAVVYTLPHLLGEARFKALDCFMAGGRRGHTGQQGLQRGVPDQAELCLVGMAEQGPSLSWV